MSSNDCVSGAYSYRALVVHIVDGTDAYMVAEPEVASSSTRVMMRDAAGLARRVRASTAS